LTTLPEADAARLAEVADLLLKEGCRAASIYYDGDELVINGYAPSYQAKRHIQTLVSELVGRPVRNSMRIYPG